MGPCLKENWDNCMLKKTSSDKENCNKKISHLLDIIHQFEQKHQSGHVKQLRQQIINLITRFDHSASDIITERIDRRHKKQNIESPSQADPSTGNDIPRFMSEYYSKKQSKF